MKWSIIIVGEALDPFLVSRCAKVHQQAERQIHQSQIGQNLFGVHRRMPFGRFQFDQQTPLHQQVDTKTFVEQTPPEPDRNDLLPFYQQSAVAYEFEEQQFIYGFEQTWSQLLVE